MGKLVRDRIPDIIREDGGVPQFRILDEGEYRTALREKLLEECSEAASASDVELLHELADVLEVLRSTASAYGWTLADVERAATNKALERGRFDARIWLE